MDYPSVEKICPYCHSKVPSGSYFCPNCGKQLKSRPLSMSISKQATIYLTSLLLPPFGLIYAWKYLKASGSKQRAVGVAAAVLTVASSILAIWFAVEIINSFSQTLESINDFNF